MMERDDCLSPMSLMQALRERAEQAVRRFGGCSVLGAKRLNLFPAMHLKLITCEKISYLDQRFIAFFFVFT